MGVVRVIIHAERTRTQWNGLTAGIDATVGNIGPFCDEHGILKQIVGCAILLEDDDHVLDLSWLYGPNVGDRVAATAVQAEHYSEGAQEQEREIQRGLAFHGL
jgi:hypothetical protein